MNYVTKDYYKSLCDDYKGIINGVHHIVTLDKQTGATILLPVELVDNENALTEKIKERYNVR